MGSLRSASPLLVGFVVVGAGWASEAAAAEPHTPGPVPVPSLDLRGFHASTDAASGIYLEPAASPATLNYNFGYWLNYVYRPVTLRDTSSGDVALSVIKHQVTSDFTANIGFGERVALGFDLPVLLGQTGDEPTAESRRVLGDTQVPLTALGDLGLDAKITVIKPTGGEFGGFALALHNRLTLPSGDDASFLGEGHVADEFRALAEYRLVALSVHLALGVKLRAEKESFACADTAPDDCTTRFGHEIPFGLGFAFRPQAIGLDDKGRWTWFVETHGYLPVAPERPFQNASVSEMQLAAGARLALHDISFLVGAEMGLIGGIGNPAFRALASVAWAPRLHDADHDGVEDEKDQCRELAEDHDNYQDEDGCPEGDNDDDGVPDGDDKCPLQKEDEDGFQDDDGCPDFDNDKDGILDVRDACPNDAGPANADPKKNGCPGRDMDGDGIEGDKDKCPDAAEDKDGFQDDDGCPDPDNDGDGIADAEDACPNLRGPDSTNPKEKGCPDSDRDHDTFADGEDKCPDQPEVFNGIDDLDGCPEDAAAPNVKNAKPLVVLRDSKDGPIAEMSGPVKFTATSEIEPASMPLVRALAVELRAHPTYSVAVGVRPSPKGGPDGGTNQALIRAFAVVDALRRFTRRDSVAETVAWIAVKGFPGAEAHGIGFMILGGDVAKPEPKPAPPGPAPPGEKKPAPPNKP